MEKNLDAKSAIGQIKNLAKFNMAWEKQSIRDKVIWLCDQALNDIKDSQRSNFTSCPTCGEKLIEGKCFNIKCTSFI